MFLFMFDALQSFESWMRNWLIFQMAKEHKTDSGYYNFFFFFDVLIQTSAAAIFSPARSLMTTSVIFSCENIYGREICFVGIMELKSFLLSFSYHDGKALQL